MAGKLIAYQCTAPAHPPSHDHADKLTIHAGSWAFCAFGARADGHEWSETGGEDFATLMRKFGLAVTVPEGDIDPRPRAASRA